MINLFKRFNLKIQPIEVNFETFLLIGGLAVAVPSEIKGFFTVWKRFGKLKWAELVQPSIEIAKEGFPLKDLSKDDVEEADENIR